jgi:hypothetical protein
MAEGNSLEEIKDKLIYRDNGQVYWKKVIYPKDVAWLIEQAEILNSNNEVVKAIVGEETLWQEGKYESKMMKLQNENKKLKAFHDYFSELYGQGLEVAYWHQNGDLEPFDEFFEGAKKEMG